MQLKIQMSEDEIKTVLANHIAETLTDYVVASIVLTRKRNDGVVADLVVYDDNRKNPAMVAEKEKAV